MSLVIGTELTIYVMVPDFYNQREMLYNLKSIVLEETAAGITYNPNVLPWEMRQIQGAEDVLVELGSAETFYIEDFIPKGKKSYVQSGRGCL